MKISLILSVLAVVTLKASMYAFSPSKTPMLTLAVDHSLPGLPPVHIPAIDNSLVEYKFQIGEVFNLSCVVKHPLHRIKIAITREQIYTNGYKTNVTDLLSKYSLDPNQDLNDDRLTTEVDEYDSDSGASYLRVSLLIKDLDIKDTGFYKCTYDKIVKQIKVVVYSE